MVGSVGGFWLVRRAGAVGCMVAKLSRRGAQLCASTYTWLAGLIGGLGLAGRVGTVGWLWLVRRVGVVAVQMLLVVGLGIAGRAALCIRVGSWLGIGWAGW